MVRLAVYALLLGIITYSMAYASSAAYLKFRHDRTIAHVVIVNLADSDVRVSVALAEGGAGRSESFKSIVARTRPTTAITGTFFDTKTLLPTGDIGLCGTIVYSGCIGSALCIDSQNKASVVTLREGRKNKWAGYETVLCAGPTLIADGKVAIALKHEGFRNSLLAPARRTAVGITQAGKLALVTVNRDASLYDVAKLMLALNVKDALCLDGGSSTGLYHAGRFLAVPARQFTNCLVVYSRTEDFDRARTALAPKEMLAKAEPERDNKQVSETPSWLFLLAAEPQPIFGWRR